MSADGDGQPGPCHTASTVSTDVPPHSDTTTLPFTGEVHANHTSSLAPPPQLACCGLVVAIPMPACTENVPRPEIASAVEQSSEPPTRNDDCGGGFGGTQLGGTGNAPTEPVCALAAPARSPMHAGTIRIAARAC